MQSSDSQRTSGEWTKSWPVVFTSTIGLAVSTIHIYSLGLFIEPLEREFGWGRTEITAGLMIVSIVSVVLAPIIGILIDKFGARRIGLPGVVFYCIAIALLATIGPFVWMWLLCWGLVALGSVCIKSTVWTAAVASHFTSGRGLALALALCGTGVGQALLPFITNQLLAQYGWRGAYLTLAGLGAVISLPLMIFFFFDAHEESRRKRGALARDARRQVGGVTVKEGLTSSGFFRLAAAALFASAAIVAMVVHFVPMLTTAGLSRASAAAIAGVVGIASITGRISCGYMLDRFNGRIVGAVSFVLPSLACLFFLNFDGSSGQALAIAVVVGLSLGAEIDVVAYLATRYFGMQNFATLFGTIAGLLSLGAGLGPLLVGMMFDRYGNYTMSYVLFIPLFLTTAALIASLGPYPTFVAPDAPKPVA